jgi:hypothetical protein
MKQGICLALVVFPVCAFSQDDAYRGLYTRDHEVHTFSPCESEQVFWVSGTQTVLDDLDNYLAASRDRPYQPAYIEFRGHSHLEVTDGFAADYDGIFHISEVQAWRRPDGDTCGDLPANSVPSPVAGVEKVVARSESEYEVHSIRGIGAVQLFRPPWSRLTIDFVYDDETQFGDLEGVSIVDVSTRAQLSIDELVMRGELLLLGTRLMIMPRDRPLNWRIDFVDYYR